MKKLVNGLLDKCCSVIEHSITYWKPLVGMTLLRCMQVAAILMVFIFIGGDYEPYLLF